MRERRFSVLGLAMLAACAGADPPLGPAVRPVARGATEAIRFNALNMGQMRRGMEIGRYVWGIACGSPYGRVFWVSGLGFRRENTFRERFAEVFGDAGFDVAGAVYADGADRQRARYIVTGELREVRMELCREQSWLFGADQGISGVGTVKIDWTVYAPAEERVAYRTSTTGRAKLAAGVPEGDVLLIEEGFNGAAEALAADPGFRTAVVRGGGGGGERPPDGRAPDGRRWRMVPEQERDPLPVADEPVRPVALRADPPRGGAGDGLVRVGDGMGVVVGEAEGTALVLAPLMPGERVAVRAGGTRVEGGVAARDAGRGLMLVRVPARLAAIPLRATPPDVSEPVIATGAMDDFATGMVSASGDVLLADLEGAAPQPGDPLLDAQGHLLGLALPGGRESGLHRFTGIGAALAALGVAPRHAVLDGRGRPPT